MADLEHKFDTKVQEIFDVLVQREPAWATQLGIHEYDDKLADMSRERFLEDIQLTEKWLDGLKGFDEGKLSQERKIDLESLIYTLELALYQEKEIRNWERNPYLVADFLDHIEPLFRKDFAPLSERIELITGRVNRADEFLGQLRTLLGKKPEKLWCGMAIELCQLTPHFLNTILKASSESGEVTKPVVSGLNEAIKKAEREIKEHKRWLEEEVRPKAVDQWAMGREKFEKLLQKRLLGMNSDQILALGQQLLEERKEKLDEIAHKVLEEENVKPGEDVVKQARQIIESDHPQGFSQVLKAYEDSIRESRQFVIDHNLATFPEGESLTVMETPIYLRSIMPLAAYISPGRFDKKQEGYYLVTPREEVTQFNYPDISNTTVHEGYPGHHLQLSCANRNPSLARVLLHPTETIEGWAHYCEELMKEHGYHNGPKDMFVQVNDEVWRAVRIILDVKMHRGEMGVEEAVEFLVRQTGMNRHVATSEVRRYTLTPSYQLSYLLGKVMIKQLKDRVKKVKGDRFNEREFHDALLYAGSLPIKLMEKALVEY